MREGCEGIVADVLTTGLLRVADELALFIVVDGLSSYGGQHDAEYDEHGQPDLPHKGGVVGDLIQKTRQEAPAHGAKETRGALSALMKGHRKGEGERGHDTHFVSVFTK